MRKGLFQLSSRLALDVSEAAGALGVSKRHLQNMLPEVPHFYMGNRLLFPVAELREWMGRQSEAQRVQASNVVDEIVSELSSRRDT